MMNLTVAEYLAVRLMLAYLHPDVEMRPAYVMAVESESGLTPDQFDLANVTAWRAAQFWLEFSPETGRELLNRKLEELIPA